MKKFIDTGLGQAIKNSKIMELFVEGANSFLGVMGKEMQLALNEEQFSYRDAISGKYDLEAAQNKIVKADGAVTVTNGEGHKQFGNRTNVQNTPRN